MKTKNKSSVNDAKEVFANAINESFSCVWEDLKKEIKKGLKVQFRGYDFSGFEIVDGCCGELRWCSKLKDLVSDFIKERDGDCGPDEVDWCKSVALDLEQQAKRIRKHATKLERKTKRK